MAAHCDIVTAMQVTPSKISDGIALKKFYDSFVERILKNNIPPRPDKFLESPEFIKSKSDITSTDANRCSSYKKRFLPYQYIPLVSIICFLLWIINLRSDFSWDDADPEILDLAWRMAQGQDIYRDINALPFVFSTYSPLYYAATAFVLKFTGLSFLPARLVSFIADISIALAIVFLKGG